MVSRKVVSRKVVNRKVVNRKVVNRKLTSLGAGKAEVRSASSLHSLQTLLFTDTG